MGRTTSVVFSPTYLGVTLDRTLSFRRHIEKTKAKVSTRNNLLHKLTSSKWGANPHTLRTTALALCYSTAEYAAPVWERSSHAHKLDVVLNQTCRIISGCLKPTISGHLHLLSGIAPPAIRRATASRIERSKQQMDPRHPMFGLEAPTSRLKSRKSFLTSTAPLEGSASQDRISRWKTGLSEREKELLIEPKEHLPPGSDLPWPTWKSLNRLRTLVGRCQTNMLRWGFSDGSDLCRCGAQHTMAHLLVCPDLQSPCDMRDLSSADTIAIECANYWKDII